MCIAFMLWQSHPAYPFYLALNRDEVLSRPTLPVHWWYEEEKDNILAGKDLTKGGTWFGCTNSGRIALVTTFRDTIELDNPSSRGELIVSFLKSTKAPLEYLEEVSKSGHKYNGFNLIVVDLRRGEMAYVSNRPKEDPIKPHIVQPGFHVLCNGLLNTPWPKVSRGRAIMEHLLEDAGASCNIPKERVIEELLMDDMKANAAYLPNTGHAMEWEHKLSSICVDTIGTMGAYGTRSMIIFSIHNDGNVNLYERYKEDGCWKNHEFYFKLLQ